MKGQRRGKADDPARNTLGKFGQIMVDMAHQDYACSATSLMKYIIAPFQILNPANLAVGRGLSKASAGPATSNSHYGFASKVILVTCQSPPERTACAQPLFSPPTFNKCDPVKRHNRLSNVLLSIHSSLSLQVRKRRGRAGVRQHFQKSGLQTHEFSARGGFRVLSLLAPITGKVGKLQDA